MEALVDYIKPELLITAIALYFMGIALKEAQAVKDKYIPLILGCAGILICGIYIFATCSCKNAQDIAMAVFTSTTQGVLVAGLSTYVNQLIKQLEKDEYLHRIKRRAAAGIYAPEESLSEQDAGNLRKCHN